MKSINQTLSNSIFIGIEEKRCVKSYPAFHEHNVYEIYILTSGTRKMCIGNSVYSISEGDVSMILPNVKHRSYGKEVYSGICVEFSEKVLQEMFNTAEANKLKTCFKNLIISLNNEALNLLWGKAVECVHNAGDKREFLTFLSGILVNTYSNENAVGKKVFESDMSSIGVYIQENHLTIKGLDEIAKKFGITKSHLCYSFKCQTGMTVVEYIHRLKTQYACKMLQETDLPVNEIANKCGFDTVRQFNKVFKNIVAYTPTYIRKFSKESGMYINEND